MIEVNNNRNSSVNEKVLITSKTSIAIKLLFLGIALVGVIFTIGIFCDGGLTAWRDYAFRNGLGSEAFLSWGGLILMIVGALLFIVVSRMTMVVTDQRVYGRMSLGGQVDIPLDSVSSVGIGLANSIVVASASGKICFIGVRNKNEIHKLLSKLLMERNSTSKAPIKANSASELKELKELLDSGVITAEEFEAKKKQLLGL